MPLTLPSLPYAMDALQPHISKETLEYHYGKHHKAYMDKLNDLMKGKPYEKMSLEEIVTTSREKRETGLFNNAAQVWNHTFYWNCLSPKSKGQPSGNVEKAITSAFGSFDVFKEKFTQSAVTLFGSGWAWLARDQKGGLSIVQTSNAENLIGTPHTPVLTCDVWEHAYYVDYRNARPKYLDAFWKLINWDFVQKNFE